MKKCDALGWNIFHQKEKNRTKCEEEISRETFAREENKLYINILHVREFAVYQYKETVKISWKTLQGLEITTMIPEKICENPKL